MALSSCSFIYCYLKILERVYCIRIELLNTDIKEHGNLSCGIGQL